MMPYLEINRKKLWRSIPYYIFVVFIFVFCKHNNNSGNLRSINTSLAIFETCSDSITADSLKRAIHRYYSKDSYYHALLEKWQKNTDWKEQGPIDSIVQKAYVCSSDIYDVIHQAIRERYHFKLHPISTLIEYTAVGEQKEYWLVQVRRRGIQEIWILISRINKDILSMESYHTGVHILPHLSLLRKWLSCSADQRWSKYNKSIYENIDSVAAITIALAAATEHYGLEMLPVEARSMGIYKEHWIVYCFPIIPPKSAANYTDLVYYDSTGTFIGDFATYMRHPPDNLGYGNCYWEALSIYVYGGAILGKSPCGPIVTVLVSKENGQILFMDIFKKF
jgi:hypothetical protein